MTKKMGPSEALEQAMADALAAVERVEQHVNSPKSSDGADNGGGPSDADVQDKGGAAHELTAEDGATPEQDEEPAKNANGKIDVLPAAVDTKPKPADDNNDSIVPRDQLLRLAADFDNYRKRAVREMDEARKYGIERLLKDLLPLLDNLDRALAHSENDKSPVVEGIRMVAKQAHEILAGYGVKAFSSVGQPFDPEQHEAVAQVESAKHPAGSVMEEMLRGYRIHERLLRPAQVVVAAAAKVEASATTEGAGPDR